VTTDTLTQNLTVSRRNLLFAGFCLILAASAFEPLRRLVGLSVDLNNADLSYIGLIPFISAALIYWERQSIFVHPRTSFVPAVMLFAAGAALYLLGQTGAARLHGNDDLSLMAAAVIAFFFGGVFLIYGQVVFKAAAFPLLFLLLAIPLPAQLLHAAVTFLQHASASLVSVLFALTGTPVYRNDVSFSLPTLTITIAEECSGLRSTLGILIVTLLAGRLLLKSNWRRLALLLAVIPISVFKNAVRIVALTLLAIHVDMRFLTGGLHHDGGIVFMMIGLVLLYPLLALLIRSEKDIHRGVRI
jgi:exosortase